MQNAEYVCAMIYVVLYRLKEIDTDYEFQISTLNCNNSLMKKSKTKGIFTP